MGFCAFIGGGVSEIASVASGSGTANFSIPADALPGDIFIGFDWSNGSGAVTPSGFQTIATSVSGSGSVGVSSWKKLVSGDAGSAPLGMSGGTTSKKWLLLRADDDFDAVTVGSVTAVGFPDAGATRTQNIAASGVDAPLVVVAGVASAFGWTDGSSPPFQGQQDIGGASFSGIAWTIHNSSPVDQQASFTGFIRHMHTFYLQVS